MLPSLDRTARDAAYLTCTLLTSIAAFAVWVAALTLSLTLGLLIIGLPVVLGAAYVMRWTAELDRQNAALVFGRPVRGALPLAPRHRPVRARLQDAARPAGVARLRVADHALRASGSRSA